MLALDRRVGGAPTHGEVVAANDDRATVDLRPPEDEVGWCEVLEVVSLVVGRPACDLAQLVEGAGIHELGDPLADGVPAAVMLPLDALRPAEPLGQLLAAPQLVQLLLPVHAGLRPTLSRGATECTRYLLAAPPLAAVSSIAHVKTGKGSSTA